MSDELQPGQDDLIKEDKLSENIKRAFRRRRDHIPTGEELYTDRKRKTRQPAGPKQKGPGPLAQFKDMWRQAVREAEIKQQKKRAKKNK